MGMFDDLRREEAEGYSPEAKQALAVDRMSARRRRRGVQGFADPGHGMFGAAIAQAPMTSNLEDRRGQSPGLGEILGMAVRGVSRIGVSRIGVDPRAAELEPGIVGAFRRAHGIPEKRWLTPEDEAWLAAQRRERAGLASAYRNWLYGNAERP